MSITVRLPATLRSLGPESLIVEEPVETIEALVTLLDTRLPGLAAQLDDSVFNFAVNDQMLLHRARAHPLKDGDTVEIVPAISGGEDVVR